MNKHQKTSVSLQICTLYMHIHSVVEGADYTLTADSYLVQRLTQCEAAISCKPTPLFGNV
jgi:hypothetical protein